MSVVLSSLTRRGMTIADDEQISNYGNIWVENWPLRLTHKLKWSTVPIAKKNANRKPKSVLFYNPAQAVQTQSSAEVYLTLTKFVPPVQFSEFTSHLPSPSGILLKKESHARWEDSIHTDLFVPACTCWLTRRNKSVVEMSWYMSHGFNDHIKIFCKFHFPVCLLTCCGLIILGLFTLPISSTTPVLLFFNL